MSKQRLGESLSIVKASETRKSLQRIPIGWQGMGLLIGHHLQTVFQHTHEAVSRAEIIAHVLADPAAVSECVERLQGRSYAQLRISPTRDELLRLDEKLDVAHAAAPELDIVSLDRDCIVAAMRVDLALHRMHAGHCRGCEIVSPAERRGRCGQ